MVRKDLIGQVLHDTHRIVRLLGKGGMGAVYEAVHVRLDQRRFAIKVLHRDAAADPSYQTRFRREARIATELKHPNIVEVFDFYEDDDGQPCMVMEYLEGEDLAEHLEREQRLPLMQLVTIIEQVADALTAAHTSGIVHRDLKPANIYLLRTGDGLLVKLLDFGISKIRGGVTMLTHERDLLGTPHYMSPEQAEGQVLEVDQLTDIFALGTICYQALTGVLPFDASSIPSVFYRICHHDPQPASELVPGLPVQVDQVLQQAMAKRKEERFATAEALADALGECLGQDRPQRRPWRVSSGMPRKGTSTVRPAVTEVDVMATTQSSAAGEKSLHTPTSTPAPGKARSVALGLAVLLALSVAGVIYLPSAMQPARPDSALPVQTLARPRPDLRAAVARATPDAAPDSRPDLRAAQVRVTLKLTPARASVTVDGEQRRDNPLLLEVSEAEHTLVVRAPGFRRRERTFVARQDSTIKVRLRRLPAPAPDPAKVEPLPAPAVKVTPAPGPAPGKVPQPPRKNYIEDL